MDTRLSHDTSDFDYSQSGGGGFADWYSGGGAIELLGGFGAWQRY